MTTQSRRLRSLALVLAAALGFAVIPAGAAQASGPGTATFTVTAEGTPVVGQYFFLSGPDFGFAQSDSAGVVTFGDLALGEYSLSASFENYPSQTVVFTLTEESPNWTQSIDFQPWPTGTGVIEVTVVDQATGDPIPDAQVVSYRTDAPGPTLEGVTDAAGHVTFGELVAGEYVVTATAAGFFANSSLSSLADGATVQADIALVAADAQITGRVVDQDGNGIGGIAVNAFTAEGYYVGSATEPDGSYVITGAGAGTWTVMTPADTTWESATASVVVTAGSSAVAPDLVLVPRFTGTISGLVGTTDGVPETEIGGVFDICVTVLTPSGAPVPGASSVTGGDSFYFFYLAPGDYTVRFDDCDADRPPHRYQTTYLGGGTSLAGATIVTVETLVDLWLDTTLLAPEQANPEPTAAAIPVDQNDLKKSKTGKITAPAGAARGDTVEIEVGVDRAGQWVSVWLFPGAAQLGGWHQVAANGTVEVTVPAAAPLGNRKIAVQDADNVLIGWAEFKVTAH